MMKTTYRELAFHVLAKAPKLLQCVGPSEPFPQLLAALERQTEMVKHEHLMSVVMQM